MTKRKKSLKSPFFKKGYVYLIPPIMVLATVSIYPLIYSIWLSTHRYIAYIEERPFIGGENFLNLITSSDFINSLSVSSIYISADVAGTFLFGLILALILNEKFKGNNILRAIFIVPLTISPVVVGFTWRYLLDTNSGLIGSFILPLMGIRVEAILGSVTYALMAVIVADIWAKTPLMFLILLAGLQAVPPEQYDAAKIDGASSFQTFIHVTLPHLAPAIVIALMLKIIDSINAFDHVWVMTGGGPGLATQVLALLGIKVGFVYFNFGQAAAMGWVIILISMLCIIPLIKSLVK